MLTRLPIMLLAYPEIFLRAAACAILVIDLYLKEATRWITYALSLAAVLGCAVLTTIVTGMTGGQLATTYNGMFVSDMMASTLKMFTYIAVALCLARIHQAQRHRDARSRCSRTSRWRCAWCIRASTWRS